MNIKTSEPNNACIAVH